MVFICLISRGLRPLFSARRNKNIAIKLMAAKKIRHTSKKNFILRKLRLTKQIYWSLAMIFPSVSSRWSME